MLDHVLQRKVSLPSSYSKADRKCFHRHAGTYGGARNPSNFLCLILKILQIQPADEVITEYIIQEDSKYLRILGAFYLRLTSKPDKARFPPAQAPVRFLWTCF